MRQFIVLVPLAWAFSHAFGVQAVWYAIWIAELAAVLFAVTASRRILKARENIKNSGFEGKIRVVEADTADVLPGLEERFDLIFLDPPYATDLLDQALKAARGPTNG